jgi:hypothetical protein
MLQQEESLTILRDLLPVGSTAHTILRHVSRSGMSRRISVVVITPEGPHDVTWHVAQVSGYNLSRDHEGLVVGGCGMDMGFAVVYSLSRTLYPNGHRCIGQTPVRCPSNDHSNDYGSLARQYDEEHDPEGNPNPRYSGTPETYEARSAYCAARSEWMRSQEDRLWSPERVHSDGGYAVSQRWL